MLATRREQMLLLVFLLLRHNTRNRDSNSNSNSNSSIYWMWRVGKENCRHGWPCVVPCTYGWWIHGVRISMIVFIRRSSDRYPKNGNRKLIPTWRRRSITSKTTNTTGTSRIIIMIIIIIIIPHLHVHQWPPKIAKFKRWFIVDFFNTSNSFRWMV